MLREVATQRGQSQRVMRFQDLDDCPSPDHAYHVDPLRVGPVLKRAADDEDSGYNWGPAPDPDYDPGLRET